MPPRLIFRSIIERRKSIVFRLHFHSLVRTNLCALFYSHMWIPPHHLVIRNNLVLQNRHHHTLKIQPCHMVRNRHINHFLLPYFYWKNYLLLILKILKYRVCQKNIEYVTSLIFLIRSHLTIFNDLFYLPSRILSHQSFICFCMQSVRDLLLILISRCIMF